MGDLSKVVGVNRIFRDTIFLACLLIITVLSTPPPSTRVLKPKSYLFSSFSTLSSFFFFFLHFLLPLLSSQLSSC